MFNKLRNLFGSQPTGYTYNADEHTGWGDRISWSDFDNRRIVGWLNRTPRVGDDIIFSMQGNVRFKFRVKEAEPCRDPRDMFFATRQRRRLCLSSDSPSTV